MWALVVIGAVYFLWSLYDWGYARGKRTRTNQGGRVKDRFQEGTENKGGVNPRPTIPRPVDRPKGQGGVMGKNCCGIPDKMLCACAENISFKSQVELFQKAIRWFIYAENNVNKVAADRAFELLGKLAPRKGGEFDLDNGETIIELEAEVAALRK